MVIHLITRLPMGGATQLVFDISKRMRNSGEDVLILTGVSDAATSLSAANNRILDDVRAAGIPVKVVPRLQHKISLIEDLRAFVWLCKELRNHRGAVVHLHSSKAGILGRIACWVAGIRRVVFHVHGWSFSRSEGFARSAQFLLERLFYPLTATYVFVCEADMLEFVRMGGNPKIVDRSRVIYPGTAFLTQQDRRTHRRELRARLGYHDGDFVIGTVGRLDFQKNPQAFVAIAREYAAIDDSARFLWVGEGMYRGEVEALIASAGLTDRFVLAGFVDDAEPYNAVFDAFVLSSRYEGLPLSVVKALSCAMPVVGFLVNGMNDFHGRFESVIAVPPGDSAAFVRGLSTARAMLVNGRETLEREAQIVRETMNGDRMYDAILDTYASLGWKRRAAHGSSLPHGVLIDAGSRPVVSGSAE